MITVLSMRFLLITLSILFLSPSPTTSEVIQLNDSTFEDRTRSSSPNVDTGSWLLVFESTHCPHCHKLQPHLEQLSVDRDIVSRRIHLASINVLQNRATSVRFGIRGSPTLLYLHEGRMYKYTGKERTSNAIKDFLTNISAEDGSTEDSEAIPNPTTTLEHGLKIGKAMGLELWDAALGKHGSVGYAMLVFFGVLMFLFFGAISLCFLPSSEIKTKES